MYVLLTGGVALVPMRHLEHRNATPFSKIMTPFFGKKCYICATETKSLKIKELKNMKTKFYIFALAAISMILALSGCSESEDLLSAFHSDPNAVRITAQVGKTSADGFTRSFPLGDAEAQKKFKDGDMISVKADGQDAVTYQLNNNEWQPQGGKFLKWESETMNFTAYYPASFNGTITQPTEYTDEASLAKADFMSFSGPQTNTNNSNNLTLTMERKMARVVVEIDGFKDQYAGATIDNINSLSICGVKAYKHSDNKFYALIKPCEAQNSATFISLDVAEGASKTTTETLAGIPELTAGNSYTYQLTVGKDKVSVSGITVKDWTTGNITGGSTDVKDKTPYVTFSAPAEQMFKMVCYGGYTISNLEYSVNFGDWKEVKANEGVTFGGQNGGLRLRGKNIKGTAENLSKYSNITFAYDEKNPNNPNTVKVACTGDIRTLLDYSNYKNVNTSQACFANLFYHCWVLTSAPNLPATELAFNCYNGMFYWCPYLQNAPELPATKLKTQCYQNMFWGCTRLTKAPKLPATKLAFGCYYGMFMNCYRLQEAPELPATTLAEQCYIDMFAYCNFTKAPKLPATELKPRCYTTMFSNCEKLKEVPELPATKLAEFCYTSMFAGCTALTKAPKLAPAETVAKNCYRLMFDGCKELTDGPELKATTLAESCYEYMFNGCSKLASVSMLVPSTAIESTKDCVKGWLQNAGTSATSRTLKVMDAAAYTALEGTGYLPAIWKKGATNTTVLNKDNGKIE